MYSKPLVYENIAIGAIAQRIGECRLINRYIINPQQYLTQHTVPLEALYRDSIIAEGDKFIVIEFKAPRLSSKGLKYEHINIKALMTIAKRFHEENVFLALIHAYLHPTIIPKKNTRYGFYLWFATPGTTAFIPLSNLPRALKDPGSIISLEVTNVNPPINMKYVSTQVPSCVKQPTPIVKQEPHCASCGGLFYKGPGKLKITELQVESNGSTFNVRSYTFASLMKSFTNCLIGFRVGNLKDVEELYGLLQELLYVLKSMTLLVSGKESITFISMPLLER